MSNNISYPDYILAALGKIRKELTFANTFAVSSNPHKYTIEYTKSSCYIWICALLEDYVKNYCKDLNQRINALNVSCGDISYCLFTLNQDANFERLYAMKKMEKYSVRGEILDFLSSTEKFHIGESANPLDGKTIKPDHIRMIWKIYGLPGDPFHNPIDSHLLLEAADIRNDLAHGEVSYQSFARRRTIDQIIRSIDAISDLVEIMIIAHEEYFERKLYLRM